MRKANSEQITELIGQVAKKDRIKVGVAKARFAGKANYSVPSLERLMRGELASEDHQLGTLKAAKSWGIEVTLDQLFLPASGKSKRRAS